MSRFGDARTPALRGLAAYDAETRHLTRGSGPTLPPVAEQRRRRVVAPANAVLAPPELANSLAAAAAAAASTSSSRPPPPSAPRRSGPIEALTPQAPVQLPPTFRQLVPNAAVGAPTVRAEFDSAQEAAARSYAAARARLPPAAIAALAQARADAAAASEAQQAPPPSTSSDAALGPLPTAAEAVMLADADAAQAAVADAMEAATDSGAAVNALMPYMFSSGPSSTAALVAAASALRDDADGGASGSAFGASAHRSRRSARRASAAAPETAPAPAPARASVPPPANIPVAWIPLPSGVRVSDDMDDYGASFALLFGADDDGAAADEEEAGGGAGGGPIGGVDADGDPLLPFNAHGSHVSGAARAQRCSLRLTPYQSSAIRRTTVRCRWQRGFLLFYRAGSGKSIYALTFLYNMGPPQAGKKHFVFVPEAIKGTYADAPTTDLYKVFPAEESRNAFWRGVRVMTYEELEASLLDPRLREALRNEMAGCVAVADEAHYFLRMLRNPAMEGHLRYVLGALGKLVEMTGTPLMAEESDLGALLSLVEDEDPRDARGAELQPIPADAQGFRKMFFKPLVGLRKGYVFGAAPTTLGLTASTLIACYMSKPSLQSALDHPDDAAAYMMTTLASTVALNYVGGLFNQWTKELDATEPDEAAIQARMSKYTMFYDYDAPRLDGSVDQRPFFPKVRVIGSPLEAGAEPELLLDAPNVRAVLRAVPRVAYTMDQMRVLMRYCAAAVTDPREQEALGMRAGAASSPKQTDPFAFSRSAGAISSLTAEGVANVRLVFDARTRTYKGVYERSTPPPPAASVANGGVLLDAVGKPAARLLRGALPAGLLAPPAAPPARTAGADIARETLEAPKFKALADLLEVLASCRGWCAGTECGASPTEVGASGGGAAWDHGGAYATLTYEQGAANGGSDILRATVPPAPEEVAAAASDAAAAQQKQRRAAKKAATTKKAAGGPRMWAPSRRFIPVVYSGFAGLAGGAGFSAYLTSRGLPHIYMRPNDDVAEALAKEPYPLRGVPPHLEGRFITELDADFDAAPAVVAAERALAAVQRAQRQPAAATEAAEAGLAAAVAAQRAAAEDALARARAREVTATELLRTAEAGAAAAAAAARRAPPEGQARARDAVAKAAAKADAARARRAAAAAAVAAAARPQPESPSVVAARRVVAALGTPAALEAARAAVPAARDAAVAVARAKLEATRAETATDPVCIILHPSLMEGLSFTHSPLLATLEPLCGAGIEDQVRARILRRFSSPDPTNADRVVKVIFAMSAGYGTEWLQWARANMDYLEAGSRDWYAREWFTLPFFGNRSRYVHSSASPDDLMIKEVALQKRVVGSLASVLSRVRDADAEAMYCGAADAAPACAVCLRGECDCELPRGRGAGGGAPPLAVTTRECRATPFTGDEATDTAGTAAWAAAAVRAWERRPEDQWERDHPGLPRPPKAPAAPAVPATPATQSKRASARRGGRRGVTPQSVSSVEADNE